MRTRLTLIAFLLCSTSIALNATEDLDFKSVNKEHIPQPATVEELAAPFKHALAHYTQGRMLLNYDTESRQYWDLKSSPYPTDETVHATYKLQVSFKTEAMENGFPTRLLLTVESFESKGRGLALGGLNQGDKLSLTRDADGIVEVTRLNGEPLDETMAATLIEFGLVPVANSSPLQIAQAMQLNSAATGADSLSGTLSPKFVMDTFGAHASSNEVSLNRLHGTNADGSPVTDTLLRTKLSGINPELPDAHVETNDLNITHTITNKRNALQAPPLQRRTQVDSTTLVHIEEGTLKSTLFTTLIIKTL